MRKPLHPARSSGFSLIEVMIVLLTIGILATLAYPSFAAQLARGRRVKKRTTRRSEPGHLHRGRARRERAVAHLSRAVVAPAEHGLIDAAGADVTQPGRDFDDAAECVDRSGS